MHLRRVDPQYRVSIPPEVRRALGLQRDDHVAFDIGDDGAVRLFRAEVKLRSGPAGARKEP
jgi:bifunctional DNA-binding transcriptional regulator/antitoxin component of YhaV-PrlF toxin-antitoxin module